MRFEPGESLYQITDLSSVWVIADVFEQDIGQLKLGSKASVSIPAYPDKRFQGNGVLHLPQLECRNPHHPGPGRAEQPAVVAQARHVCPGGSQHERRHPRADGSQQCGDRQREASYRARAACRRAL
jgi:hypothetical protein